MSLIKCPECGREISSLAVNCPNCGYPIVSEKKTPATPHSSSAQDEEYVNLDLIREFPMFPVVMNVGNQIVNWGFDAALQDCYYSASANYTQYVKEGKVDVLAHTNGICIMGGLTPFYISYQQIIDMKFISHKQLINEDKSVIGRAVVGGLLLGPLGAVVGGISGVGSKTKTIGNYYFVINFNDVYTHRIQTILISTKSENVRFIERCEKEKVANNTPSGNNYVCDLLDKNGNLSDSKVIDALKIVGQFKLAEQIAYIENCSTATALTKLKSIGNKNNVDPSAYKSSGCMISMILIMLSSILVACSLIQW